MAEGKGATIKDVDGNLMIDITESGWVLLPHGFLSLLSIFISLGVVKEKVVINSEK